MRVRFLKEIGEHCIVQVIERGTWLETGDARFRLVGLVQSLAKQVVESIVTHVMQSGARDSG
jgi:hypothetical protein